MKFKTPIQIVEEEITEIYIRIRSGFFDQLPNNGNDETNLVEIRKFLRKNYKHSQYRCHYTQVYGNQMRIDFRKSANIDLFLLLFNGRCQMKKHIVINRNWE